MSDSKDLLVQKKCRGYVFTLNNWTEDEYEKIKKISCDYLIIGKETGESGTPHLQGFIYKKSVLTFNGIKKSIPRAHIEAMKGTAEQASTYCKKENNFYEHGEHPVGKGTRTDLDAVRDVIKETGKMSEVVQVATSYQSVRMAECILKYNEKPRNWKPNVIWIYGETGIGKTRKAYEMLGDELYRAHTNGKWFEGYDAHENVLIDDLRGDFMKYHELLGLLDRYGFRVECKGGSRQFLAKNIIITSHKRPEEIFCGKNEEDIKQLLRRIDEIIEM